MSTVSFEKKSNNELKEMLKSLGLAQNGEKGTLIFRLKLYYTAKEYCMEHDGINICQLKITELKKYAAKNGVSPIGTNDEILTSLVEYLKSKGKPCDANQRATSSNAAETGSKISLTANESSGNVDPVLIAKRILELEDLGDYEGILNIATTKDSRITKTSSAPVMRKAYLKLSLLIHPDKLSRLFDQATKAFQSLVRAFEFLSSPDLTNDPKESTSKATGKDVLTISRSNEGCYRTRVCCPRCKQPWSEGGLDGNPDYFYNFMMMGLKQFTCSTCLCWFGCMSAVHKCPKCSKPFEYSPKDYHRKIKCGNPKCSQPFGFYLFKASDRVIKDLKNTLRDEQEAFIRNREAKVRRAQRSSGRSSALSLEEEERAFSLGLIDCCPRCGESFEDYPDEEIQRQHLVECMDDAKHAEFKARRQEKLRKEQEKALKVDKQLSVQSKAVWEFLGAETSQLYLLDDEQLHQVAQDKGLDVSKSMNKADVIAEVAMNQYAKESRALGGGGGFTCGSAVSSSLRIADKVTGSVRKRMTLHSLPRGYQSFSYEQLRALCASYGFLPEASSKIEILEAIEREITEDEEDRDRGKRRVEGGFLLKNEEETAQNENVGKEAKPKVYSLLEESDSDYVPEEED